MPDTRVPDAEMELLACLQRRGEATARDLRKDLWTHRPMAHGSVLTLLGRLDRRGFVTRRKGPVGKAFVYTPTRQAATTTRPLLKRLVNRVFHGDPVGLVASLFETRPPTPQELDDLQRLIVDLRKKRLQKKGAHGEER
jgi:BlaI family transcriptional regulator, penicillinase repressor